MLIISSTSCFDRPCARSSRSDRSRRVGLSLRRLLRSRARARTAATGGREHQGHTSRHRPSPSLPPLCASLSVGARPPCSLLSSFSRGDRVLVTIITYSRSCVQTFGLCRSVSCSRRTTTSSARAFGACSRPSPKSRSSRSAATSMRCSRGRANARTSSSPTSGCLRSARRGHPGGRAAARDPSRDRRRRPQPVRRTGLCARAARGRHGPARVPAQGASRRCRAARRGDPGGRGRRLGDRSEGRRGARGGQGRVERVAARRADAARARRPARDGRGQEQRRDRAALFLTERRSRR